jgi:hypothetical protein
MPEPTLQATALRYAAGDLSADEAASFEALLARDQSARDALAEAVRLSAAALGREPPGPDRSFRAAIRERLIGWCPAWLRRRAYHGHPLVWAGLGASAVAACTVIGLVLADPDVPESTPPIAATAPAVAPEPHDVVAIAIAPEPRADESADIEGGFTVAEIWAHLSTTDSVEKAHDDEQRWRQRLREANVLSGRTVPVSAAAEPREQ